MTLRTATRRAFLYPPAAAAASGWWLANGTISISNVVSYLDNPAVDGTDNVSYSFTAGNPITIAAHVALGATPASNSEIWNTNNATSDFLRMRNTGVLRSSVNGSGTDTAIYANNGDTHVMWVCDGTNTLFYIDNVLSITHTSNAIQTFTVIGVGNRVSDLGNQWPYSYYKFWIGNIEVDATQRAGLYASMTA